MSLGHNVYLGLVGLNLITFQLLPLMFAWMNLLIWLGAWCSVMADFCGLKWSCVEWRETNTKWYRMACVRKLATVAWSKSTTTTSSIWPSHYNCCQFQVWKITIGWFKCNMDVAFHEANSRVPLGCCVCDSNGRFITTQTRWKRMKVSILEREAMTLLEVINFVSINRWHNVFFESDLCTPMNSLLSHRNRVPEFYMLLFGY